MRYLATTYRTLSGVKEILETPKKKDTQWVVYRDNKPAYFVDFFDLAIESNAMMNSLVLCTKRSLDEVLSIISERNNVNLSIPKVSRLGLKMKLKSEYRELNLDPIPEKWLAYSL
ncbi:hypothetical protein OD91_1608 [Lutibacter sp. Hel_I_33_5]|uniref:hypothetical protein n=1 Tax=Lutibacter sp. Hel_I_33_5 TaxID=1566289 RepID=UPI0011A3EF60|nr:hypothetical protein [Lutibacter sp. Hel_I_33_5]TVZ56323.1 hypothetical protein OD91_1608 [Lutibacter sp. Hel_I_33_5]